MPSWLVCRPKDRHGARTAQDRQTALAALTWRSAAPLVVTGKNSSGSSLRQAPRDIQPKEPEAVSEDNMIKPPEDLGRYGHVRCARTAQRPLADAAERRLTWQAATDEAAPAE
jgi:hypothetical protein